MNSKERYYWRRLDVFIDNFKHNSPFIPVFLLLTLSVYLFTRFDE